MGACRRKVPRRHRLSRSQAAREWLPRPHPLHRPPHRPRCRHPQPSIRRARVFSARYWAGSDASLPTRRRRVRHRPPALPGRQTPGRRISLSTCHPHLSRLRRTLRHLPMHRCLTTPGALRRLPAGKVLRPARNAEHASVAIATAETSVTSVHGARTSRARLVRGMHGHSGSGRSGPTAKPASPARARARCCPVILRRVARPRRPQAQCSQPQCLQAQCRQAQRFHPQCLQARCLLLLRRPPRHLQPISLLSGSPSPPQAQASKRLGLLPSRVSARDAGAAGGASPKARHQVVMQQIPANSSSSHLRTVPRACQHRRLLKPVPPGGARLR